MMSEFEWLTLDSTQFILEALSWALVLLEL